MKRRKFIALLGITAFGARTARAQGAARMPRIGVLMGDAESDPEGQARIGAFRRGLEHLGWVEGRNLSIDYRWAAGDAERTQSFARDLVAIAPKVILVQAASGLAAALQETKTIPVVFVGVVDPVGSGFISSFAHPAGNATGFTNFDPSIGGKWLGLLKEVDPHLERVLVIGGPGTGDRGWFSAIVRAAPTFGIEVTTATVSDEAEIERAISMHSNAPGGGLIDLPDVFTRNHRKLIISLAARSHLPSVFPVRIWAEDGGLMSYGLNIEAQYELAASYVDRILKGAAPGDLPVQGPTQFELIINLKTANTLGLTIPPSLLAQADELIE